MKPVQSHAHVWYAISTSDDGRQLMACSVRRCIETRIESRGDTYPVREPQAAEGSRKERG